jgi:PQQ-dependent catabolism-associated CXXCW motif protein
MRGLACLVIAAPAPATLAGTRVLTTKQAETHLPRRHSVFHRCAAAHPGTIWRAAQHPEQHLAAGHGYGPLAAATEDYLRRTCPRVRRQQREAVRDYCQADCWMSWNAAKRVLSYGYPNVAWYPEGTDGWQRANLPVAESQPEPRADQEK